MVTCPGWHSHVGAEVQVPHPQPCHPRPLLTPSDPWYEQGFARPSHPAPLYLVSCHHPLGDPAPSAYTHPGLRGSQVSGLVPPHPYLARGPPGLSPAYTAQVLTGLCHQTALQQHTVTQRGRRKGLELGVLNVF